jgi:plastocyanin
LSVPLFAPPVGGATGNAVSGRVFIDSAPVQGAVVYLRMPPGGALPSSATHTIQQKELRFDPAFLVVPVGATIRFENHDEEIHNIHSRAADNRFDIGAHMPGTVKEVTLKNPGAVPIQCRTHHSMRGLIFVAPSAYFAVSNALGQFEIPRVPEGRYRVEAWHPRLTPAERGQGAVDLTVAKDAQVVELRFTAKAPAGTDLTEAADGAWIPVVEEIRAELDRAIGHWKNGSFTAAAARVMSAQSRLYGESGLRDAITKVLGKDRAAEHERRLDALRKGVQGIGSEPATEVILKKDAAALVGALMEDAEKLPR